MTWWEIGAGCAAVTLLTGAGAVLLLLEKAHDHGYRKGIRDGRDWEFAERNGIDLDSEAI